MTRPTMSPRQKRHANEALRHAKNLLGGWPALANELSRRSHRTITFQGCHYWLQSGNGVPPYWARLIEEATKGRIRRGDLRPDLFDVIET